MATRPWLAALFSGLVGCAALSGIDDFGTEEETAGGGRPSATSTSTSGSTSRGGGEEGVGGDGLDPTDCPSQCPGYRCDVDGQCSHWASCVELDDAGAPSGAYEIDPGPGIIDVYCDNEADGGGWALLLKADGLAETFRFDAPIWEDDSLLAEGSNDLSQIEAKLPAFLALDIDEVRVVMVTNGMSRRVNGAISQEPARTAREWFSGFGRGTDLDRQDWTNMVPAAQLQDNCNREGLNVLKSNGCCAKVRIGIATNNENHCDSPDSALGVGLSSFFVTCGGDPTSAPGATVGVAWADCTNEVDIASFAFVYGR